MSAAWTVGFMPASVRKGERRCWTRKVAARVFVGSGCDRQNAIAGADLGATGTDGFPGQANYFGQVDSDYARLRADPDGAERLAGTYGSEAAPRGCAIRRSGRCCSSGGERPSPPSCRSRAVKLRAA